VEINSSFHRAHRPATYARWAASVPEHFRFSVKAPRAISHERRLVGTEALLEDFLSGVSALGEKLGCVLIQLPPSLEFDRVSAESFLRSLRVRHTGPVALEPRHASWFTGEISEFLDMHRVTRVAADPALVSAAGVPGGWSGTAYYRLHGSPRVYYSAYDDHYLRALVGRLMRAAGEGRDVWCIFDNTAAGAALGNALRLIALSES
jgi:uncharacterized protein YecE (DUF72 family)